LYRQQHDKQIRRLNVLKSRTQQLICSLPFFQKKLAAKQIEIAPNLYKLARFKKRIVATELQNSNWIRNLGVINNPDVLEEFTLLYIALSTVVLNDQRDQIIWQWISNVQYTAASAYNCQFTGAMTSFPAKDI
jgi:hypothetical protein